MLEQLDVLPEFVAACGFENAKAPGFEADDFLAAAAAAEEGLEYNSARISRQPNTIDCHRLIYWAEQSGQSGAMKQRLMDLYFKDGADLTDPEVMLRPTQEGETLFLQVASALDRLSDQQREVVILVAVEEMSYRDVAEITGVPVGTVMSRLSRARSALRELIGEEAKPSLRRIK